MPMLLLVVLSCLVNWFEWCLGMAWHVCVHSQTGGSAASSYRSLKLCLEGSMSLCFSFASCFFFVFFITSNYYFSAIHHCDDLSMLPWLFILTCHVSVVFIKPTGPGDRRLVYVIQKGLMETNFCSVLVHLGFLSWHYCTFQGNGRN